MTRTAFSPEVIEAAQTRLEAHPVYGAIETREQLCRFMEHHIYSVWDFMSLVKYLQNQVAPASYPWVPVPGQGPLRYFINSLVQEEESDEAPPAVPRATPATSSFTATPCGRWGRTPVSHWPLWSGSRRRASTGP